MQPLTSWVCDTCGDAIESAAKGLLIWKYSTGNDWVNYGFRIVHQGRDCDDRAWQSSQHLATMLGASGQAHLLSFLTAGPIIGTPARTRIGDMNEFVDVYRRLQTPWYEEARQRFADPEILEHWSDANEFAPYVPEALEEMARGRV